MVALSFYYFQRSPAANADEDKVLPNLPEDIQPIAVPTQTPSPTPTPSPSPTPTPLQPTPTPTPPTECEYMRGDIIDLGFSETTLEGYNKIFQRTGEAVGLNCLDKMIQKAIDDCQSSYPTSTSFGIKHHDDCLAWEFAGFMMPDWAQAHSYSRWVQKVGPQSNGAVCDYLHNADMGYCPAGSPVGFGLKSPFCTPCGAGHFYFAKDPANPDMCKVVQPDPSKAVCGTFSLNYWHSTPLSLVWSEEEPEMTVTFNRFPLDPRRPDLWHVWQASDVLPLVVYDPQHQGRITSAEQLFGPWTFGGQRFAALNASAAHPQPWQNGYEALATLDANGNGRIDGDELKPLALWFDKNQNGLSEEGEVTPLAQTGVAELSYGPVERDSRGNLFVKAGYQRVVDGQQRAGKSIDWVTNSAPSQFDLLSEYLAPARSGNKEMAGQLDSPIPKKTDDVAAPVTPDYLGGAWNWVVVGEKENNARGYFLLMDRSDGIIGYSLMETAFRKKGAAELNSYGTMFMLTGKKSQDPDGHLRLSFKLSGNDPEVVSEGMLSADRKTMEGKTTVRTGKSGATQKAVSYRWLARRR
jgi:hypothetical protein